MPRAPKKITKETEQAIKDLTRYDAKTGGLYWKYSRPRAKAGSRVGCINHTTKYRVFQIGFDGALTEHRVVFWLHHGYWPQFVDHINRDRQDNRIENLRECTHAENMRNRSNCQRGSVGIHYHKPTGRWHSSVSLGYHDDLFEAACIVKSARNKLGL